MENYVEEKMKEKIRNDDEDEGYGLLSHEAALEKKKKEVGATRMQRCPSHVGNSQTTRSGGEAVDAKLNTVGN